MTYRFQTTNFKMEYTDGRIDKPVLLGNHCHAQFEMIGILEGDISILLEGTQYRASGGQTVIIPPLAYHSITAKKGGIYRRITALFEDSALPKELHPHFTEKGSNIFIAPWLQPDQLQKICQTKDTSFYEPLAEALMVQIFYDTLRAAQSNTASETDDFLQKVTAYVEEHLGEKITLEALAKHTSRSMSSFCHLFEEKMKISPKQYILQKKLAIANKLIEDGVPPTLAATRIGYDNYSNFYRMYRKRYGISPAAKKA